MPHFKLQYLLDEDNYRAMLIIDMSVNGIAFVRGQCLFKAWDLLEVIKSHACEDGTAHITISFWYLLMNLMMKWANKKTK